MDNLKRSADSDVEHDDMQDSKRQRMNLEEKINLGDRREQVINVINREFKNEITKRQEEVHLIQQRLLKAQKTLHLLKYVIIKSFYDKKELNITNSEESIIKQSSAQHEIKNASSNAQNRIHPAVKKLLGKKPVESVTYDFARTRGQVQNIFQTIVKQETVEDTTDSTEQNTVDDKQKIPQSTAITNTEEIKVPIRNRQKIKYDVVIGNISKYSPSNNSQDASTHKWMVYVRGPRDNPDISNFVKKVRFFLHPSYQPNDIVELEEAPFHLSRRGWGEFPLRIQIHFQNSLNKPVDVIHNLKLDQNRTGRQTLGNETFINVWLYDTSTIEDNEIKSEIEENIDDNNKETTEENIEKIHIKKEPIEIEETPFKNIEIKEEIQDNYESLEYFNPGPSGSKNYIMNAPQIHNQTTYNDNNTYDYNLIYLVDHCYTAVKIDESVLINLYKPENIYIDREKFRFSIPLSKFSSTRQIVYFLFKKLPLVTTLANELSYKCCYPYAASSLQEFCSWHYAKRCCSEWYRAKQIKNMLKEHKVEDEEDWTSKFILMFGRAHAFTPLATYEIFQNKSESGKTLPNHSMDSDIKSTLTEYIPISTLMENPLHKVEKDEDEIIDIENLTEHISEIKTKHTVPLESSESDPNLLPLCNYVKICAGQLDVYLQDEENAPGILHNSAERVILQSVMCLAEELIRTAWANKVIERKGRNLNCRIERHDIFRILLERPEFDIFTNEGLGKAVT